MSKVESDELTKSGYSTPKELMFMKQYIGNACGTVAVIHALANNQDSIKFAEDGVFKKFLGEIKDVAPEKISEVLENNELLTAAHEIFASEGQSARIDRDEKINLHFVAFVHKNGIIYEMDGRKPFPISHGSSNKSTFLSDAGKVCQKFMQREPDNLNFTAIALTGSSDF